VKARVLTAAVAMPLVLGAVFCTKHWLLLTLIVCSIAVGWSEWSAIARLPKLSVVAGAALGVFGAILVPYWPPEREWSASTAACVVGMCAIGAWCAARAVAKPSERWCGFVALLWVACPLIALSVLHRWAAPAVDAGLWNFRPALLLVLLPLWAGDSAAIFAGKAFGKTPLAPGISPKKTVEGAVANLLGCMLLAWATAAWLGAGPIVAVGCGLICGLAGQAGDLFESFLKRKAGVKDSGNLLPGHGGLLDRIDSLLFSAPLVLLLLALVGFPPS
jgi:phosphatidate cytidylyltransferase